MRGIQWLAVGALVRKDLTAIRRSKAVVIPMLLVPTLLMVCLLYTSPSPRDKRQSRMPSSA